MSLIKTLRKPYLSISLAPLLLLLLLFVSCSQYENESEIEPLSLSNYVEKHLELISNLSAIIENEKKCQFQCFQKDT